MSGEVQRRRSSGVIRQPVALVDLLDRLLGTGVVLSGDLVISLAGVDLVQIRLHALITTIRREMVENMVARADRREVIEVRPRKQGGPG